MAEAVAVLGVGPSSPGGF